MRVALDMVTGRTTSRRGRPAGRRLRARSPEAGLPGCSGARWSWDCDDRARTGEQRIFRRAVGECRRGDGAEVVRGDGDAEQPLRREQDTRIQRLVGKGPALRSGPQPVITGSA